MEKKLIIEIAEGLGFKMDYDQFDKKGWIRFKLPEIYDEKDLRWIWYKNLPLDVNLNRGANLLFSAGQKAKLNQLNQLIPWKRS